MHANNHIYFLSKLHITHIIEHTLTQHAHTHITHTFALTYTHDGGGAVRSGTGTACGVGEDWTTGPAMDRDDGSSPRLGQRWCACGWHGGGTHQGRGLDEAGMALPGTTVSLLRSPDGTTAGRGCRDARGHWLRKAKRRRWWWLSLGRRDEELSYDPRLKHL
jgi:hypothetical protein